MKGVDEEGCAWGCGLCTRVHLLWNKAVFFVSKRPFICRLNSSPGDRSPFNCSSWQLNLAERYGPHKKTDLPVKPPSESIQIWLSLALSFIGDVAVLDFFLKIHPLPLIFMLPEIYYSRGQ